MQCPLCGIETMEGATFCHKCGASLKTSGKEGTATATGQQSSSGNGGPAAGSQSPAMERLEAMNHSRVEDAQAPQQIVWEGTFSSRAMIDVWAICGLITIGLLVAGAWFGANKTVWLILVAAILILWGYNLLLLISRRIGVRYQLTTQRFIHERGVIRHVSDRIDLIQVRDLRCEQGFIERILGVGTLRILSDDRSNPELVLRGIDDAMTVAAKIDETRRAEQMRRGLVMEG
jgi:membrane protein YdbS with pleckstrin-like domain